MSYTGEVLVAIMNNRSDFAIAHDRHWYRIPVESKKRWIKGKWPPKWLAFYTTKESEQEPYTVAYYSEVLAIEEKTRREIFPYDPIDKRSEKRYHQIFIGPVKKVPVPIISRKARRIVFIPTTWQKFVTAREINDLYHGSSLEETVWAELKRLRIRAEREEFVTVGDRSYFLDFAIYCASRNLDVETDGDHWHANPEKAALDNVRDNDLHRAGWSTLRFTTKQIPEQMAKYCVPNIVTTINNLGGVDEGPYSIRKIDPSAPTGTYQLGLFGDREEE